MALPSVLFLVFFAFFVKIIVIHFLCQKIVRSECLVLAKYIYLIQTIIDPSTMVIRHFKNMRFFC